ncbi:hypothetical protein K7432_016099 [Basidiobolus ranarum]|uniref:Uncharacterized protein n=1 Tax=Basidiobolus ranarum TaxID=34480 RepID=A0ABR2WFA4_9FUNG
MKSISFISMFSMAMVTFGLVYAQGNSALLKLENTPEDTAQQLSFPANSCQRVTFGPVDTASVTPEPPSKSAQAVLYRSLQDCTRRRNQIALISSNRGEVHIAQQGKFVTVGAVRILSG